MKFRALRLDLDVDKRHLRPEWMDQPGLDVGLHHTALRALDRVNALSLVHRSFWGDIRQLARRHPTREIRVLDVACGGGDVAVRLALAARRAKLRVSVDGCDLSSTAVSFARERAEKSGVTSRFFEFDVLRDDWPTDYDIISSSLFMHHLTNDDAIRVLAHMATATRHSVIINDLVRNRFGYLLARFVARLVTRSPIVHSDGPDSVAGAFTTNELQEMASRAGLIGATVTQCWPARMILRWNKT
jgi:2-polyprenyl-3-methyl-5-hydroxy-6-metoxy-1,4-benzoquinol methylase